MPNVPFRFFGSSSPVGTPEVQYVPTGGDLICAFPFPGAQVDALPGNDFYPFVLPLNLDVVPAGGKAVKWWDRVIVWRAHLTWSGTIRYWDDEAEDDGTDTFSGDHTFELQLQVPGGSLFLDERDRMRPSLFRWIGSANGASETGPFASLTVDIMPTLPLVLFDSLTTNPGPRYYVASESVVSPLFVARGIVGQHGFAGSGAEWIVTSYERNKNDEGSISPDFPGGSKSMGSGTMDGEAFGLHVRDDDPYSATAEEPGDVGSSLDSISLTITPYTTASHGGTWDTGSGALLRPSNDFVD